MVGLAQEQNFENMRTSELPPKDGQEQQGMKEGRCLSVLCFRNMVWAAFLVQDHDLYHSKLNVIYMQNLYKSYLSVSIQCLHPWKGELRFLITWGETCLCFPKTMYPSFKFSFCEVIVERPQKEMKHTLFSYRGNQIQQQHLVEKVSCGCNRRCNKREFKSNFIIRILALLHWHHFFQPHNLPRVAGLTPTVNLLPF